ncbi:MAG: VacJ family lipoprotein [Nitrospinota bacterium]
MPIKDVKKIKKKRHPLFQNSKRGALTRRVLSRTPEQITALMGKCTLLLCLALIPFPSTSSGQETPAPGPPVRQEPPGEEFAPQYDDSDELFNDEFSEEFADEFEDTHELSEVYDPIEPVNRAIFWFNDKLYFSLFKPIVRVYRFVPKPARVSVSNFFSNIWSPIRFANLLLQLKLKKSGNELFRFVTNSTIGLLGLFDPASSIFGVKIQIEDLGQTLGHYGVGHGFYLVLPGLGPSSFRDAIGRTGDTFIDPFNYLLNTYEYIGIQAAYRLNYLSLDKDTYEGIKRNAIDPYILVRDAYYQYRSSVVKQ